MALDWNLSDWNLNEIRKDSKLFNLLTKQNYRIYGLKQVKSNEPINISYSSSNCSGVPDLAPLVKLFKDNGIQVILNAQDLDAKNFIYIGLRKDIRTEVLLAGTILQTIIYYMEGRLTLDTSFKMPSHPDFFEAIQEKDEKDEKEEVKSS